MVEATRRGSLQQEIFGDESHIQNPDSLARRTVDVRPVAPRH